MRALEPEVFDTVFAAIKPLLPVRAETHPLGCHRRRVPDRDCFEVMLVHLVTGSSWEDCERLCGNKVSAPQSGPAVMSGRWPGCSTP